MARVSKNTLDENEQTEVMGRMNATMATHFISEFFGREEKIMLAKRLAIIALIHEHRPLHRIAVHLHVSETTVGRLYDRYEQGEFNHTIQSLTKNKTDYTKFLDVLDSILTVGGMMPYRNYVIPTKRQYTNRLGY